MSEAATVAGDADTEVKELVKVDGIGKQIASNTSVLPDLSADMPLEQRKELLRDTAKNLQGVENRAKIINGEILYEVSKNEYWREWTFVDPTTKEARNYAKFEEYTENELGMKKRNAYYLIQVYTKFVIELGIPVEILRDMDWTKALALMPIIDEDNWNKLFEKTKDMSVREVKALVALSEKAGKETGGKDDTSTKTESGRVTISFHPEQLTCFNDAVKIAKEFTGSDATNNCVDLICQDYIGSVLGTGISGFSMNLDRAVQNIERNYGVKLTVSEIDPAKLAKLKAASAK